MDRPCTDISILLVEDEDGFRVGLGGMLREDGHDVFDYAQPAHLPPLATLGHVHLLFSDHDMPGENGLSLADRFHTFHPALPIILVTAYRTHHLDAQVARRPFVRLVEKPILYDTVHALIHQLAI